MRVSCAAHADDPADSMIPSIPFLRPCAHSSGKVDRRPTAPLSMRSGRGPSCTENDASALAEIWSKLLRVDRVSVDDNFFELGGDSILSLQIVSRSHEQGLRLTPQQIFRHQTIAELALFVAPVRRGEEESFAAAVPLTPIQQWFFEQDFPSPHLYNLALWFEVQEGRRLDPELLREAVRQCLTHHDALRLRFVDVDSHWRQTYAGVDAPVPLSLVDLSAATAPEQRVEMESQAVEVQGSLTRDGLSCAAPSSTWGRTPQPILAITSCRERVGRICRGSATAAQQLVDGIPCLPRNGSFQRWRRLAPPCRRAV